MAPASFTVGEPGIDFEFESDEIVRLTIGLVFSSIIILGSIGLSLVYSIADFANFAHGDSLSLGSHRRYRRVRWLRGRTAPFSVSRSGSSVSGGRDGAAAVVAVLTHILVYKPSIRTRSGCSSRASAWRSSTAQ